MPIYRDENIKNIKRNDTNIAILMFFNIIDFILIGLIVVLFYLTMPVNSTKVLFIPKGSTSNIISHLNKSGYEMNALDEIIIKMTG
ncbi:4-amino-4-deoxychorismate lyase, partial [Aliarcobacter butzleri]|nr:4-amino-4-deoxychorismate lyase [Aliarcobacter butzleri]